jgi:hypothetical protein
MQKKIENFFSTRFILFFKRIEKKENFGRFFIFLFLIVIGTQCMEQIYFGKVLKIGHYLMLNPSWDTHH